HPPPRLLRGRRQHHHRAGRNRLPVGRQGSDRGDGMSEERNADYVMSVVQQWGAPFEALAGDERFEFEADSISVTLWKPIKVGTETVDQLRFIEPTIEELSAMEKAPGEMGRVRVLLKQVCVLSDREVGAVGMGD